MNSLTADALKKEFGYVPQSDCGEQWIVYQDHTLLVFHPYKRIKVFKRGSGGSYTEIDPTPWR